MEGDQLFDSLFLSSFGGKCLPIESRKVRLLLSWHAGHNFSSSFRSTLNFVPLGFLHYSSFPLSFFQICPSQFVPSLYMSFGQLSPCHRKVSPISGWLKLLKKMSWVHFWWDLRLSGILWGTACQKATFVFFGGLGAIHTLFWWIGPGTSGNIELLIAPELLKGRLTYLCRHKCNFVDLTGYFQGQIEVKVLLCFCTEQSRRSFASVKYLSHFY